MIVQSRIQDESRHGRGCEFWCLHGNVGLASDWRSFADHLATSGTASRAVDLWRFLSCEPLSLTDAAAALNAEAATAGSLPKILLGYSLGGRIALHSLLGEPSPWQAAVLISAHPGLENASERAARRTLDAEWATRAFSGHWEHFLENWNSQPILDGALPRSDGEQRRLLARRQEIARGFIHWSLGCQSPLWQDLHKIRIPVLWVCGENDHRYQEIAHRACRLNPLFRFACIPSAGHRCPWDSPGLFESAIHRFIGTLPACSALLPLQDE